MSKAPQGVFQEELERCISQLEADLHLTPHPKLADETQHIFKVLQSPETPLAEKQQVMSNVFGDCHLKTDEDQKSMEKGMKPDIVEVQPSKGQAAHHVKQSDPTPEAKPELFTSSGSSFQFDFTLSETDPEADPGDSGAEQVQNNVRATKQENWNGALRFAASASGQEPKFAFRFAIPDEDCPHLQLLPACQYTEHTADPALRAALAALPQAAALQKPEVTQVTESAPKEARSHVTSKIPQTETAPADEAVTEKSTGGGAAQKKKKKKQNPPVSKNKTEETETSRKAKAETNSCQNIDISHQDKKTSQSDEQLRKEVDWCVNQLELGLKTQKPTPRQAEEALRAIRTLRSDKAPLVKKRQLMRAMFGDYRKKMQEELCRELKLMETAAKSARIVELKGSIHKKNGQFIRKCLGACRKSQGDTEKGKVGQGPGLALAIRLARGVEGGQPVLRSGISPAIPAPRSTFPAVGHRSAALPPHPTASGHSAEHHDRHREGGVTPPSLSPLGRCRHHPALCNCAGPALPPAPVTECRERVPWPKGTGTELYCSVLLSIFMAVVVSDVCLVRYQ
ncbi:UPF0488 protein C8orf33 homolog isoform 3-T4 [Acridotheres tristis]